jgi:hypothetical protein
MKRLLLLFAGVALTVAQAQQPKPASVTESHAAESHAAGSQAAWSDAAWMKHYAVACAAAAPLPCTASASSTDGALSSDPRFGALIGHALPQQQSWWVNGYGGTASVRSVISEFLGIPGPIQLRDDRYVTITGCVPHDCTSRGMLWVDTGTRPATVIFVGEDLVVGSGRAESGYHLYLYASRELATSYYGDRPIGIFSKAFLQSLNAWHTSSLDLQKILLVTVVWPNGRSHDQFPSAFSLSANDQPNGATP